MNDVISKLLELEYFEFNISPLKHNNIAYIIEFLFDNNYTSLCVIDTDRIICYKNYIYDSEYFDSLYLPFIIIYDSNDMLLFAGNKYYLSDVIREHKFKQIEKICNI